jgi:hypothetical protein
MSTKWIVAAILTLGVAAVARPAAAQMAGGDQSRSTSLLEVTRGTKIYKHNISDLNRTDTDTYSGSSIYYPVWTTNARFYLQGNSVMTVGNGSDTMSTWVTFTPPVSPSTGATLSTMRVTKCGSRLCVLFGNCQYWQVYSYDMSSKALTKGAMQMMDKQCIRDATDDIWNTSGGGFVILWQATAAHEGAPWSVQFLRYSPIGTYLTGRNVGTAAEWNNRIAQAMAPNRADLATLYVLDTNFEDSFVKRVRVSDGAVVASHFHARPGFSHHDLAFVDSGRNVALIGSDGTSRYSVVTFDDQNLNVRQDKVFNY